MQDDSLIKDKLKALESLHNIRILYACESGSRAWGFESKDSDWDVRFIYMHPPEWYLSVFPEEADIESSQSINMKVDQDLHDLAGWDLKKVYGLLFNSNPVLWEWLTSPTVYHDVPDVTAMIRESARHYYTMNACIHHYYNMANGNFMTYIMAKVAKKEQVELKKYLYVLRPTLACLWKMQSQDPPPMQLNKLIAGLFHVFTPPVRSAVEKLVMAKKAGTELGLADNVPVLDEWLSKLLRSIWEYKEQMPKAPERSHADLNKRFRDAIKTGHHDWSFEKMVKKNLSE